MLMEHMSSTSAAIVPGRPIMKLKTETARPLRFIKRARVFIVKIALIKTLGIYFFHFIKQNIIYSAVIFKHIFGGNMYY